MDESPQAKIALLEVKNRHLSNELEVTKGEYERSAERYFDIHANLGKLVEERAADLVAANQQLRQEIEERKKVQRELDKHREYLEELVEERAAELKQVNAKLVAEIAEHKLAAHALRQSEEKLRGVIENTPDIIAIVGKDGEIKFINRPTPRLGPEPLTGKKLAEVLPEPAAMSCMQALEKVFSHGGTQVIERMAVDHSFWHSRVLPLRRSNAAAEAMIISVDVTESVKAEKLREDIERITRHDLKTPLNGIVSVTQILELDDNLTEEQRKFLRLIQEAANKTINMISLSLDIYKMENGTYSLVPAPVNLVEVLHRASNDLIKMCERKKIQCEIILDGRPVAESDVLNALGEKHLCYSMFANLVKNAFEASPVGQNVRVDLSTQPGGRVRQVAIHNQGAVPESIRGHFFERYVTAGKKSGTGLGTYSAKLIATSHGGDITMESSDESGTLVTVTLPG